MKFQTDVPLQLLNTLRLKSRASALCTVTDTSELTAALDWARAEGLPARVLGEGSNVVLPTHWDALIILQRGKGIDVIARDDNAVHLRVTAGECWHEFVTWSLRQGYFGLENLALIPGTVGAAPIQNVGAYGVEVAAFVERVHVLSIRDGKAFELSTADCEFAYRDSIFKQAMRDEQVITAVDFCLPRKPAVRSEYPALQAHLRQAGVQHPSPQQVFDAVVDIRSSKLPDPALQPNAGSFFKNPVLTAAAANELRMRFPELPCYPQPGGSVKVAAAWLIDRCGWRGYRSQGVGVHNEHALVLINEGGDSAEILLQLADRIAADVSATFNIDLDIEPRVYH